MMESRSYGKEVRFYVFPDDGAGGKQKASMPMASGLSKSLFWIRVSRNKTRSDYEAGAGCAE